MTEYNALPGRLCRIYKGKRRAECYLYVDMKQDLERVPQALLDSLGELTEVMTLLITADKKLARVQAPRVLDEIRDQGYFLQLPPAELIANGQ